MNRARLAFPFLTTVALGCAVTDATSMVRVQAAKDFVCVESTVDVHREIDGSYVALGCGRRGVYHAVCDAMQCTVSKGGQGTRSPKPRTLPQERSITER